MERLKQVTHIDIKHVPYRGSAGATQDIVGGHVTGGFLSLSIAAPLAQSNSLRILGVASRERVPTAPELPERRTRSSRATTMQSTRLCASRT
jgi:tripartite-type tricarboxylate transporter receptor subunit TctC